MKLAGKTVLVTGSSAGIGAGIATQMATEGADVIVNYCNDQQGAQRTAQAITEMGRKALVIQADVSLAADVDRMFKQIKSTFGRLDILVNNAGITPKKPFEQIDEAYWDKLFTNNLKSVFLCCRHAIDLMPSGSVILNISSIHANVTTYNFSAYAAAKAGMESLTRSLAIELGQRKIRVNALRIGWIVVEREPFDSSNPDYRAVCDRIPIGRVGQVADVAPTAVHLCCDDAGFITGQVLGIDGGAGIMVNSPFAKGFVREGARKD